MLAKVQKWGNSLGIRIPKLFVKIINLKEGAFINLTSSNNSLIITINEDPLDNLLEQINSKNLHKEAFGQAKNRGSETW